MKLSKILLTTMLVSPMLLSSTQTFAAEAATKNSDAVIDFVTDNEKEKPKDPNDPGNEVIPKDPEDPTKPLDPDGGTAGPLSLDFAAKIDFGEQKISLKDKSYYAKGTPVTKNGKDLVVPNYVQFTDKRGTAAGYHLTVKQNGQFKTTGAVALKGAELRFHKGNLSTISTATAPANVKAEFELDPDATASMTVVSAAAGQGQGQWLYEFGRGAVDGATAEDVLGSGAEGVELWVPASANALAERYATSLTWTLNDVPGTSFE